MLWFGEAGSRSRSRSPLTLVGHNSENCVGLHLYLCMKGARDDFAVFTGFSLGAFWM